MEVETSSSRSKKNNDKIAKVLRKFLEPNFKIKNDVYLNLFLTHLVGKSSENKTIINEKSSEQFCQWLSEASSLWHQRQVNPPPSAILSFALNLASQLSANEQVFVKLNGQNVYESLAGIAHTNLTKDASVTLGLTTLLCSFLEHKSGTQWVLATMYWSDVINLGREAQTMYIRKKSYQFVAQLLKKTISFNQNFCQNLIVLLVKPLQDTFRSLLSSGSTPPGLIENRALFESLRPSLVFISEVLEILVKDTQHTVLNLFIELKTAELTKKLLLLSQIEEFSFELIKIRCILLFSKLSKGSPGQQGAVRQVAHDSTALFDMKTLFDVIQNEMDRDHVRCVIQICHYAHTLYSSLAGRMPLCIRKGEPIEFQNQMVLFQIMPIMVFLSEKRKVTLDMMLFDVFKREFIQKTVKLSAIRTMEICYRWKERLKRKPDLVESMTFGLQYMIKTKRLLNKERAAIFFQPLVYSLKATLTLVEEEGGYIQMGPSYAVFLHALIETIIDLVQSFDLTWIDSIETICIMCIACEFLNYTHWEQKLMISGLRLLNLAISKYMSPDMILLMDDSKDSFVSQTGSLLYAKCHDTSWEVRDTALENVYTLSLNAICKFPSYTNIILEAGLPQLVVQMALRDGEYYVRATAFRCLQQLIQIQEVWNVFRTMDNFLNDILDVFENETEGVVRKEAATLVHNIGKSQGFPKKLLPRVYDTMTHAAVGDLHWEVKLNALEFWLNVFETHLQDQGMLDYAFPPVTFSKELRKIVTLNEEAVRGRLIKVLNQMSHVGCLYVLKCACLDDCDIEVSKKATEATVWVSEILKTYKVPCNNIDISEPPSPSAQGPRVARDNLASPEGTIADCTDLASPQSSNSLLDPISPLPMLPSPSLNLDLFYKPPSITSFSSTFSSSSSSPFNLSTSQQTYLTSNYSNPSILSNQIGPAVGSIDQQSSGLDANHENGNHLLGGGDVENCPMETIEMASQCDPLKAESILNDLLNSNDMALLQQIYKPSDQVKNTTSEIKKRTYLAPSEYLKFVYNEAETNATEKTQWLESLDEFDSLLDDILKEYDVVPDVNNMDCY